MVHDTHGTYSKPYEQNMTLLKRPAAKITHLNHDKRTFYHSVLQKE